MRGTIVFWRRKQSSRIWSVFVMLCEFCVYGPCATYTWCLNFSHFTPYILHFRSIFCALPPLSPLWADLSFFVWLTNTPLGPGPACPGRNQNTITKGFWNMFWEFDFECNRCLKGLYLGPWRTAVPGGLWAGHDPACLSTCPETPGHSDTPSPQGWSNSAWLWLITPPPPDGWWSQRGV